MVGKQQALANAVLWRYGETGPLDLRYEWAAKRVCYRLRYREIADGGYSEDRVKRAILKILKEADVRNGK